MIVLHCVCSHPCLHCLVIWQMMMMGAWSPLEAISISGNRSLKWTTALQAWICHRSLMRIKVSLGLMQMVHPQDTFVQGSESKIFCVLMKAKGNLSQYSHYYTPWLVLLMHLAEHKVDSHFWLFLASVNLGLQRSPNTRVHLTTTSI